MLVGDTPYRLRVLSVFDKQEGYLYSEHTTRRLPNIEHNFYSLI